MADSLFEDSQEEIDYLKELTKEGGKYDRTKYTSEEELLKAIAKGKYHADKAYALKLEEHDQLREDYLKEKANATATAKFEDLVAKLENRQDQNSTHNTGSEQATFDQTKIDDLINQRVQTALQQADAQKKEQGNLAVVESRLRDRFGDNAKTILRDKMQFLGLTSEDLKFLAKKSPEAVINALGLASQPSGYQGLPNSNIRSDGFKHSVETRDAVYYEKLRKENPKEYYSEKTSTQRLKDMDHPDFLKRYEDQQRANY